MRSVEEIKAEYPLHWHIWHNDPEQLQAAIEQVKKGVVLRGGRGVWPQGQVLIELAGAGEMAR